MHHHYATKAELGGALIARYTESFGAALDVIDRKVHDPIRKLRRYVQLYQDVLTEERLCLCGMLAAEYLTLPKAMQDEIRRFFDLNEVWLGRVVEQGRRAKVLHSRGSSQDIARLLLSALEGAMLMARPYNDAARFATTARQLLADLKPQPDAPTLSKPKAAILAR